MQLPRLTAIYLVGIPLPQFPANHFRLIMTDDRPKIMIASLGTRGDVQPYVALASELAKRGADVVLSTGEGFETMIESAGARARPVPVNYQELLQKPEISAALHSLKGMARAARQSIQLQRDVARVLWEIGLDQKPALILFNLKATVMTLVARRLAIPALPTALQPATEPTGEFPLPLFGLPAMGSYLNRKSFDFGRLLMQAGLRPLFKPLRHEASKELEMTGSTIDGHFPGRQKALCLQAYSRALVPTPEDWGSDIWHCGYWFTEAEPDYRPPEDLDRFLSTGEPPVYLGFGSMPSKDPADLTRIVLAALAQTGQRAVLATGWGGLTKEALPVELSGRLFLIDKAPHSWLFPKCAGIVHHGGAGTTHEAVRWGKPTLVCPVFGDQPFWGQQIHRISAGPEPIRQKKLTPTNLAEALKALERDTYKQGAESARETINEEPGAGGTAKRLMSLVLKAAP